MKNLTLHQGALINDTDADYGCIQCIITRTKAFELLQSLSSQLMEQEVQKENSNEVRLMLYGDINTLQE